MDSYEQAEAYLYGRINYERAHSGAYSASDFKLERIGELLERLGNPQRSLPAVHITGTKGKGSTAAMCAAMLQAGGMRVGLFTSPHVSRFEERMTVDGRMPDAAQVVRLTTRVRDAEAAMNRRPGRPGPTFFEILTAMAWLHFVECAVDIVVLEVGLGGLRDATNLCAPAVCVITNISRDHVPFLGHTLADIAAEKAGIIKPGVPVVSGATAEEAAAVIGAACRRQHAPLYELGRQIRVDISADAIAGGPAMQVEVTTPWNRWPATPVVLHGRHQAGNAALAVAVVDVLRAGGRPIPASAINDGMRRVTWPMRIEVVRERPTVILDAGHNWASAKALAATLDGSFRARRRTLIFGGTRDKDVSGLLRLLLPRFETVVLTRYLNNPRSVPVEQLAAVAGAVGGGPIHTAGSPREAWDIASRIAGPDDLIVGTGSFFLAAELRDLLCPPVDARNEPRDRMASAAHGPAGGLSTM